MSLRRSTRPRTPGGRAGGGCGNSSPAPSRSACGATTRDMSPIPWYTGRPRPAAARIWDHRRMLPRTPSILVVPGVRRVAGLPRMREINRDREW